MRAIVTTFRVPKVGSSWQEYEDAAAVGPGQSGEAAGEFHGPWLAAAIADGASEALLARQWANELVSQFSDAEPTEHLAEGILASASRWDAIEANYRQLREEQGNPSPGTRMTAWNKALTPPSSAPGSCPAPQTRTGHCRRGRSATPASSTSDPTR